MPPVAEHHSPQEASGPFTPVGPFQCLSALGANPSQLREDSAHLGFPGFSSYANQSMDEEHNGNGHAPRGVRVCKNRFTLLFNQYFIYYFIC